MSPLAHSKFGVLGAHAREAIAKVIGPSGTGKKSKVVKRKEGMRKKKKIRRKVRVRRSSVRKTLDLIRGVEGSEGSVKKRRRRRKRKQKRSVK